MILVRFYNISSSQKALKLPPVHIFGLAIGCCISLQLASAYPDLVLSLTFCSPLPATEVSAGSSSVSDPLYKLINPSFAQPEDIASGRLEVYNLWVQAFNHDGHGPPIGGDQAVLGDLLLGATQLCFNNSSNRLTDAYVTIAHGLRNRSWTKLNGNRITRNATLQAMKNRAGSPQKLIESYHASVGWFLNRRPQSPTSLAKVPIPLHLAIKCAHLIKGTNN